MLLGRVTGTVVASRKEPLMEGWKLLVVRQLDAENREAGGYVVAADTVGAGVGEVVLYATAVPLARRRRRATGPATP